MMHALILLRIAASGYRPIGASDVTQGSKLDDSEIMIAGRMADMNDAKGTIDQISRGPLEISHKGQCAERQHLALPSQEFTLARENASAARRKRLGRF
jgi:hypothetical protein